jgi:hypothetical protein
MKSLYSILSVITLAVSAAACSSSGDDKGADDMVGAQQSSLTCAAGEMRACPCLGQGMGMQSCTPSGGYGPCMNCPAAPPSMAATGGTSAPPTMVVKDAGKPPVMVQDAGAKPKDAGSSDAAAEDGGMVSLPAGAEPGVSCGVGLPTLCALDGEKCCVRSLQTDTCIADDAKCTCDLDGCTVMEARCDGPEDCTNGQVCCGTLLQSGSGYQDFTCAAQCQSSGNQRIACHEDDAPCPSGMVCANSQLLTNVQVCVDPASLQQ